MVQRRRVVPALREGVEDMCHCWAADLRHRVVPGRGRAVPFVERRCLGIAGVGRVVATTVAEVDAADERDVVFWLALATYDQELLVVGPTATNSLVEERLSAALIDDGSKVVVLLAVEPARVRPPQQRPDLDTPTRRRRQELSDGRAVVRHAFVGVAAPVGQEDPVTRAGRPDDFQEAGKVVGAVDARDHEVARGPRPFRGGEKPVAHPLRYPAAAEIFWSLGTGLSSRSE